MTLRSSALRDAGAASDRQFDQERPGCAISDWASRSAKPSAVSARAASTPMRVRQPRPVEVRVCRGPAYPARCGRDWRRRSRVPEAGSDISDWTAATVVTSSCSRAWVHRACRRVHRRPVGLQRDHVAAGGGDRRAGGEGRPEPIAPPVEFSQSCGGAALVSGKKPRPKVTASSVTIALSGSSAESVAGEGFGGRACPGAALGRGPRRAAGVLRRGELICQPRQRRGRILIRAREHMDVGSGGIGSACRIGEERQRLGGRRGSGVAFPRAPSPRHRPHRGSGLPAPAPAARHAGGALRQRAPLAGQRDWHAPAPARCRTMPRLQHQQTPVLLRRTYACGAAIGPARGGAGTGSARRPRRLRSRRCRRAGSAWRSGRARCAPPAPRGGIGADGRGVTAVRTQPSAARPALGVGGQRRVERAVVGGLVADDVDHGRRGAARVVQVGEPLARPGPQCSSVAAGLPAMRA